MVWGEVGGIQRCFTQAIYFNLIREGLAGNMSRGELRQKLLTENGDALVTERLLNS